MSYNEKHNGANGEANHDGESFNRSWNHGVEGPTDDPAISASATASAATRLPRCRSHRLPCSSAATSSATPSGNNNAYCQDNELSWYDWVGAHTDSSVVRRLVAYRAAHPVFRRRRWFQGSADPGMGRHGFRYDGEEMTDDDRQTGFARSVGVT